METTGNLVYALALRVICSVQNFKYDTRKECHAIAAEDQSCIACFWPPNVLPYNCFVEKYLLVLRSSGRLMRTVPHC